MSRRLTIIQGHPDPAGNRLCHALADAYAGGAAVAGHAVRREIRLRRQITCS
jgi:putative NADPH-quinone reductase